MCDMQEPKNLEDSIGSLGAGVTGLCEHASMRAGNQALALPEQPVLLNAEPSLQTLKWLLHCENDTEFSV